MNATASAAYVDAQTIYDEVSRIYSILESALDDTYSTPVDRIMVGIVYTVYCVTEGRFRTRHMSQLVRDAQADLDLLTDMVTVFLIRHEERRTS